MKTLLALAPVALIAAGCSTARPPAFTAADARVTAATEDAVAMQFVLNAENINRDPLPLRTVRYTVELGGREVFKGTRSAEATLAPGATHQITLPASVARTTELPAGVAPWRIRGTVTYITPGTLAETLFDTGVRIPKEGFDASGEIDLAATPTPR